MDTKPKPFLCAFEESTSNGTGEMALELEQTVKLGVNERVPPWRRGQVLRTELERPKQETRSQSSGEFGGSKSSIHSSVAPPLCGMVGVADLLSANNYFFFNFLMQVN